MADVCDRKHTVSMAAGALVAVCETKAPIGGLDCDPGRVAPPTIAAMRTASLIVALACAAVALAAAGPAAAAQRPLVYVVVLDGLDGDRVEQGEAPFISSLLAGQGASATY